MEFVEDYIWGKINETEFLKNIVASDTVNVEHILPKLETIQQKLNCQLRLGVEKNYPRLLEQVSAIEVLHNMQVHFDKEMQIVTQIVQQMGIIFEGYANQLNNDILLIQNLSNLNRYLSDGVRYVKFDLIQKAEILHELKLIIKSNKDLELIEWINEKTLDKLNDICINTKNTIVDRLKTSLKSLNCSAVSNYQKSLFLILDDTSAHKEIIAIMDNAVKELDQLFLQWVVQNSGYDKSTKFLSQLGNRLHSFLEQFQLLGYDNVQIFAREVGKIINNRVPSNTPNAIRLVQTIYKCLLTHNDALIKIIRDSLNPLKTAILSESLSHLFSLVDEAFMQDEKKVMKSELNSINWDTELLLEMETNILKTLKYISVKIEDQLNFNDDTLRLSGRISKQQLFNYQMLIIAFEFTKYTFLEYTIFLDIGLSLLAL